MVTVAAAPITGGKNFKPSIQKETDFSCVVGGEVMTKRDLIDEVNKRFPHLSRRDSEVIINAIFDSMVDALAQGDRIEIRGFGSFVVKHRRARQGRNPKSGVLVSVAAKRVPFFKVGKELRLRVDGKDPGTEEASE
jgi:integration host factor subunit beta